MSTKNGEQLLYEDISYKVRGACFEVWREFGNVFKESIIKNALIKKLQELGFKARTKLPRSSALLSAKIRLDKLDNKGFTVLELIVVASIMAILLVSFLTNFRGFENKSVLEGEADKLSSVLRQAQIYALAGQTIGGTRYNYGVHLEEYVSENRNYILFADQSGGTTNIYDSGDVNMNSYNIPIGVYIESLSPVAGISLDIVFQAPLGSVYFNNSQTQETATIILKHAQSGEQKIITVNRVSGQINVE